MINNKNIVLIGFMGSGKSTVGKLVAEKAAYSYIDMDEEIERISKKSIASIFESSGETAFRDMESSVCFALSNAEKTVVSTGGGVIKRQENISYLKKSGILVYLNASPGHIFNNVRHSADRPLLQSDNDEDKLRLINRLLGERAETYKRNADFIVTVTDKSVDEISNEIVNYFFKGI